MIWAYILIFILFDYLTYVWGMFHSKIVSLKNLCILFVMKGKNLYHQELKYRSIKENSKFKEGWWPIVATPHCTIIISYSQEHVN